MDSCHNDNYVSDKYNDIIFYNNYISNKVTLSYGAIDHCYNNASVISDKYNNILVYNIHQCHNSYLC